MIKACLKEIQAPRKCQCFRSLLLLFSSSYHKKTLLLWKQQPYCSSLKISSLKILSDLKESIYSRSPNKKSNLNKNPICNNFQEHQWLFAYVNVTEARKCHRGKCHRTMSKMQRFAKIM